MDDLISRQAAIDALVRYTHLTWEHLEIIYPMLNVFEKLPSAERHGRWVQDGTGYHAKCSVCGEIVYRGWYYSFCPNCGAKMDEVKE